MPERFWEIDATRGLALLLMVVSNFVTDLFFFRVWAVDIFSGFWFFFARIVATIFVFLVGVSLAISYAKAKKHLQGNALFAKFLKRGLMISCWGLAITLFTWFFLRSGFVVFGVLHFVGVSIILAFPFLKYKRLNLFFGIFLILLGLLLQNLVFGFPWLLWLGFVPKGFFSVDFFPLLPWFGIVLLGLFFGSALYPRGKRAFKIADLQGFFVARFFCFLGRHSLLIYLLHQPVIVGSMVLFGVVKLPFF